MTEEINTRRRRLLGTTVAGISLLELSLSGLANAQSNDATGGTKGATRVASFDNIRQINAGTLNIGYAEAGPQNGPVVILLHGWPYDIYSFAEVTPILTVSPTSHSGMRSPPAIQSTDSVLVRSTPLKLRSISQV